MRKLTDLIATVEGETEDETPVSDETDTMVPPLQQKIELFKKAVGVDSVYDQETDDKTEEERNAENQDALVGGNNPGAKPLDDLKRNAGLIAMLDDDEPIEV